MTWCFMGRHSTQSYCSENTLFLALSSYYLPSIHAVGLGDALSSIFNVSVILVLVTRCASEGCLIWSLSGTPRIFQSNQRLPAFWTEFSAQCHPARQWLFTTAATCSAQPDERISAGTPAATVEPGLDPSLPPQGSLICGLFSRGECSGCEGVSSFITHSALYQIV